MSLLRLRRGHAPNCSSGSSVVGLALVSAVAAGAILNTFADRFRRWRDDDHSSDNSSDDDAPPPRIRTEAFGAILALAGAQLHLSPAWAAQARAAGATSIGTGVLVPGALTAPTEVHLAITDHCPVRCEGCYLSAGPGGSAAEGIDAALTALADLGVFELALGGGEPLSHPDLFTILRRARDLGMVPNLTTAGLSLTAQDAQQLAGLVGQINVSIDGLGALYSSVRGFSGAERALRSVALLSEAGIRVGVNTVLSGPLLAAPEALRALGQAIQDAGAREWQWLRFKPVGRGAQTWAQLSPAPEQLDRVWNRALQAEADTGLIIRFDCALTPFLVDADIPRDRMEALGVVGCIGGESLWARDTAGNMSPCSFFPGESGDADLSARWASDPTLADWRQRAAEPPAPCASCDHAAICRGGCRAVAAHFGDPMAADPQCPRVRCSA
ncbi:MAG: radical SAM protein [Myxococcota bacterium]|nr:radical SAM protein [Myxococcota bacterium]